MKKTLLLSVVASTMIMAGGDIAPVEPVVAAPVEVSAWEFSGSAVAYTQTRDLQGTGDLFSGGSTAGALGLQLRATNADIFAGIGFGAEVSSIQDGESANYSSSHFGMQDGSALTQAYLTYGLDNIDTSVKIGRQTLPKSLSPFAFSEGWNVFQNTFDAALVVNSSLPDTTLVYAYVAGSNGSVTGPAAGLPAHAFQTGHTYSDLADFSDINNDGVHMVTAQNKSIENLTLTGTWYYAQDMAGAGNDINILWGDAAYNAEMFTVAVQGGQISPDGLDDTTAFGAKIAGNLGMFDLSAAYSSVDDGFVRVANLGTNVKTPLYTQSILDQDVIAKDADTFKIAAGMKALGGKFGLAYINADLGVAALPSVMFPNAGTGTTGTYQEIDFTYKTKIGENTTLFAAYVNQDDDRVANDNQDFIRFWARYNF